VRFLTPLLARGGVRNDEMGVCWGWFSAKEENINIDTPIVSAILTSMNQDKTIKDILETVEFIRDHAATKEDLLQFATKEELQNVKDELRNEMHEMKNELLNHIDGFIALHQKLETEVIALHGKYQRMESTVHQIIKHVGLNPGILNH